MHNEEAEDRIFSHASHTIKIKNYGSVVIASPHTDLVVSALHYFYKLNYFDLEELQFVTVRGNSRTFFPVHDLATDLDSDLVEVLLSSHAVTGCHTANKVGIKSRAVREGADCYHLWYVFGRNVLSDEMIADAGKFILKCITKHDVGTFDELHFIVYHQKYLEFDIECFPPTSYNIRQQTSDTLRTYLQCYIWLHSAFLENIELDPLENDHRLTEESNLFPMKLTKPSVPNNFPQPYNCQKCSKASVCKCRLLVICCCKCDASPRCKNPVK